MMAPARDQKVFRQDTTKQAYVALGSVAFAILGGWILFAEGLSNIVDTWRGLLVGWLTLGFGLICLINAVGQMVRPATLTLTAEGFTIQRWRGRQDVRWHDVAEIKVWSSRGTNMVIWRLNEGVQNNDVMARINSEFGYDGALGTGWRDPARSIVARMNEYKTRFEAPCIGG